MILPKRFKKGDTIGVIAPSGHLREVNIDDVEKSLIERGYKVKMYQSCYSVSFRKRRFKSKGLTRCI